jgi:hypothetical protein
MTERDPIELPDELSPADRAALDRLLEDPTVWQDPDPRLEDAVVTAIVAEAAAVADRPPPDIEVLDGSGAVGAPRRRGGRWGLAVSAVAAAAIVALVAVATVRRTPEPAEQVLALAPSADAPAGSAGSARVEERADGTRIVLEVQGLAPAPADEYYEVWMQEDGDDQGVSAGSFHLRGGGHERIELWSGVTPDEYPVVTVTLEHEDDGGGRSTRVLLSGRVA